MKRSLLALLLTITLSACATAEQTPPPSEPTASIIETPAKALEADTSYQLNTSTSSLEWEASRLAAKPHIGTVGLKSGVAYENAGEFVGGEFIIDMTKITDEKNNQRLVDHIKNADFFNVEQYPTSKLTLTKVEKKSETEYQLTGQLTILDKTNEITFPAKVVRSGNDLDASASFSIDRTKWGIVYDSGSIFQQLGDKAIKDEITYRLALRFSK